MQLPGSRIHAAPSCAPASVLSALHDVVVPHLSDNLARSVGIAGLTRYNKTGKLVGTAFTIKCRPGDNLMIYKALTMMAPGHVLVVDGAGHLDNALVGELIKLYAMQRGCVGFVVDAAIRDVACFADFPCYARGVSHKGPFKDGPGEINVPVSIGGQIVMPGDIVVGDEDGVVCFPQDCADALLQLAAAHRHKEEGIQAEIASGVTEQSWITRILTAKGLS